MTVHMARNILNTTAMAVAEGTPPVRDLVCHYNPSIVAAALATSLLGAFTSTQLMYQARGARTLAAVLVWTVLGSLVFGFCATWCLHFIGMLSCEFDVAMGLNTPLTILSAVLAMVFTFGALSTELIRKHWRRRGRKKPNAGPYPYDDDAGRQLNSDIQFRQSSEPLLPPSHELFSNGHSHKRVDSSDLDLMAANQDSGIAGSGGFNEAEEVLAAQRMNSVRKLSLPGIHHDEYEDTDSNASGLVNEQQSRLRFSSRRMNSFTGTMNLRDTSTDTISNMLIGFIPAIIGGLTLPNVIKGFVWSIALTNMHFMGVKALEIPGGSVILNPARVVLCAFVSWSVCCVGVIAMAGMESNIKQQVFFSIVAASGVAAVHFSGMYACSFVSTEPPSPQRGWPVALPIAIASIAILTCMASTGLLAHSATTARDKLADVLYTRKRLWAAIAQKENAEAAAAARSEFIASASHEIRTPLHQLQGYADLLSKSDLSEEDRRLLLAIQHATKSLSMITTNVLDWSRLEKGEAICRPVAVNIRLSCEGIVHLIPNKEDNTEVELFVVVTPEVPVSVFVDETYLQRILMNLLSNSFKFTPSGYVMLLLDVKDGVLHICVRDTGVGIPRSFLPDLFEPYKQVQARGAERGTGLGMSITKRLLERMQGDIVVDSKHYKDHGVGKDNSGSEFSLTIPLAIPEHPLEPPFSAFPEPLRVAVMHDGKDRAIEGLITAWTSFGAEVSHTDVFALASFEASTVIMVDLKFLQKYQATSRDILNQTQMLVIVPYEDKLLLDKVLSPTPSTNIIPVRKPLIWHHVIQTVVSTRALQATSKGTETTEPAPSKRFVCDQASKSDPLTATMKNRTILIVEDNKINLKLAVKMLKMLNYDVLLAEDGQEAIDIVVEHAETIDAILMDHSMPRKDGITATKEIRELEAAGLIARRQTVIAVTAASGPEAQSQFLAAGSDMFLPKPLSMAKLEQILSHFFKERTVAP